MIRTRMLGAAAVSFFFLAAGEATAAPVYTFSIVAQTNDNIGGAVLTSFSPPSLNNSGTVAFVAGFSGGKGIFTQSGALAVTGQTIGGQTLSDIGLFSSLNDSGSTAFLAPYSGGTGIFTQGGVLAKTGDTIGGKTITSPYLTPHSLNEIGAVGFYVEYAGGKGIFTQTDLLVKTGDTIGGQTLTDIDPFVGLNNAGEAVFEATYSGGSGIFTQSAVLAKTGDIIGGNTLSTFGINAYGPTLNDNGTAALYAACGGICAGVFTQDGVIAKVGDVVGGKTLTGIFSQTINNTGMVAYIGFYLGGHGIFTQNGPIVLTGDTIGGKTISSLVLAFGPSLNDRGDVAFLAQFADGKTGVVVATLTNPEVPCTTLPASGAFFGSAGGSASFSITASDSCNWTPFTHVDWITVTSGSSSGSGSVNYTVAANNSATPRSGTISLSYGQPFKPNQVFAVNQSGNTCSFTVGSPAGPFPSAGGTGSITVSVGSSSCPWTAVSHDVWITLTSGSSGVGSGAVGYTVTANPGPSRTGTLTIAGQTVVITQQAQPVVASLSPISGSGAARTFVFTFSDTDGWQDLRILNVLINNFLDGRNACYLAYDRPSNVLYLVGDAGGGLTPLVMNGSGSVSNSQCTINGAGSSALGGGNTLTLTLSMSFNQAAFAGDKVAYLAARDTALNNSGWRIMGVWSIPRLTPVFPSILSVTPSEGGGVTQQFTVTYRDVSSSANLRTTQLLINTDLNATSACYLGYDHANNVLYLVPDNNAGLLLPGIVPNSGLDSVENSQCRVNGAGTTKSESGTDLTLTISLTFKPSFAGSKVVYAGVQTISNANSAWHALGFWNAQ